MYYTIHTYSQARRIAAGEVLTYGDPHRTGHEDGFAHFGTTAADYENTGDGFMRRFPIDGDTSGIER